MTIPDELLNRKYQPVPRTDNCAEHNELSILQRPADCFLCLIDLRNSLTHALRENAWLKRWREDAIASVTNKPKLPTITELHEAYNRKRYGQMYPHKLVCSPAVYQWLCDDLHRLPSVITEYPICFHGATVEVDKREPYYRFDDVRADLPGPDLDEVAPQTQPLMAPPEDADYFFDQGKDK